MASICERGLTVPGVFSSSKNLQSKQTPGSLEIKEALSLCYRWEDEEQKGIKCVAESLLGNKQKCCSEVCSLLLSVRATGSHCLLWLNFRVKPETTPGILPGTCLAVGLPTFHSFSCFVTTHTVSEDGVYLTWNSIPHVCQHRLAACEALRPLTCSSREVIYFRFFNSVLQLEMRRSQK